MSAGLGDGAARRRPTSTSARATGSTRPSTTARCRALDVARRPGPDRLEWTGWSSAPRALPPRSSPGCSASTLEDAGRPGRRRRPRRARGADRRPTATGACVGRAAQRVRGGCGPGLTVVAGSSRRARRARRGARPRRPADRGRRRRPSSEQQLLRRDRRGGLGDGDLTSDSTRTDGLVLTHRHRARRSSSGSASRSPTR